MPQAARISDFEACPIGKPGGPIVTGEPTVLIEGMPTARVGDTAACADGPAKIGSGSPSVLIAGSKAARIGDTTCHGGRIVTGALTVLIGDGGVGGTGALDAARQAGAPFVKA
ncbi:PAAR domain-containing protein [Belnapia sp. T6]|uniref:PAAR domain-containing protein n=1 Tax=Belnapia mucosa TaxID=2804532 RepID=A0ABS1VAF7_9PROT|nr:PAAR domain-containing protein [Belnapia mucosa]MBL6458664.1 PAAR domain-containing protein [Belnapia mucosa]